MYEHELYKYKEYPYAVLSGEVVACKYIRDACQRYLSFFDKYEFRASKADKVVNFISKLKHFVGSHNGKNFELLPYQKWIIYAIFGFYHPNTDKRVCNYVYCEVARKNGKSALMSAICLYMLVADGESGAEVEMVANSAKQAKISFEMASKFLGGIDKKGKYFRRYRDSIIFDKMSAKLQILSSDASGNDGFNSYCFLLDECHEQPDSKLYDVMCSSQGMRENPLALVITTSGFNKFGFCYQYRQNCIDVNGGLYEDDTLFSAIFTLDEDDDWSDPDVWVKANPSLGVTVQMDYLEKQILKAKNNPSLEVGVRTKNLNQWVSSIDVWIPNDLLIESSKPVKLEDFKDDEIQCIVGVDLAAVSDLTAVAYMMIRDGVHYFKVDYYLPSSCLENNTNAELYKKWKRQGILTITPGNVTDYDYIKTDMLKNAEILPIQSVAYDQWNATSWAISCTEEGLPLEPYSQALWSFNRPTKEFERLIKAHRIVVDNNEITRFCFSNVVLKYDHNDNVKPTKNTIQNKIDGCIAILQCLGRYLENENYDNAIDY